MLRAKLRRLWSKPRNRALLVVSPFLLPTLPVSLPIYLVIRNRRRKARKAAKAGRATDNRPKMGELAGKLSSLSPPLRDAQAEARMDEMVDTFALCRIIGNDLVPRHRSGQALENVKFILENEPELADCKKLWLLNRIFDPDTEVALIDLLEAHGQTYERLNFDPGKVPRIGYDFATIRDGSIFLDGRLDEMGDAIALRLRLQTYRARNNYVMNNNGARNHALEMCRMHAKWALPFDGNCYFTQDAWEALRSGILANRDKRYFTVPMARMLDNQSLLVDGCAPIAQDEPQIAFRNDALARFDTAYPYGRRPKVELFVHLGIEGPWTDWPVNDFDEPPRKVSAEGYRVGSAGWVARLFSGEAKLEGSGKKNTAQRGIARDEAICLTLDTLEKRAIRAGDAAQAPVFYQLAGRSSEGFDEQVLHQAADEAMTRGPFSVTDKPKPGPSGNLHDYYHPAPYWWPDPKKPGGLPYIRKDGERVPGTEMYEAGSEQYDRSGLQRVFDDTTTLALAVRFGASQKHHDHACNLVRTWFINPETCMAPNLTSSQVRRGHQGDRGQPSGLIETKDFYYFLDAITLLDDPDLTAGMRAWCTKFLDWLENSEQGTKERSALNNHGTCYDLQCAALAAFLGDEDKLQQINHRAQARLLASITQDGDQPHEFARTLTLHYGVFNLQSWINLFDLLEGTGLHPWNSQAGQRLVVATSWLLNEATTTWTLPQIKPFDHRRLVPLASSLMARSGEHVSLSADAPACFPPHDGIALWWRLGRSVG
ncbi:alginate lyase family protein [Puniceibacterium sediminis]|uniref:Alginate lyase n=1 Tax=Puniceibacterium sediminis TaxID=1608407 RepID=A0A238YWG4_9RHOB|nr:alginate lyase family protein [Puniceibacterium sediminis]SNR75475.1 Alginate lyase [Puniceibacterium sediminis]